MEEELISVIVPVYNVEKYLNRCVDSIVNQTYKNLEIILVDDGSLDNCGKMCDEYAEKDSRIKVIHKQNGGLSDARNVGTSAAKGKYLTYIDSDDFVTKDYCEFLYNNIKKSEADISICKHYIMFEDGSKINTGTSKKYLMNKEEAFMKLLYSDDLDVSAWAKLYKRDIMENIFFPKDRLYEDSATTYKLIDKCKRIVFESEPKYIYAVRKNSITTNCFNKKKMDLILSTNEMCDYIEKEFPKLNEACARRKMYAYLSTLGQFATCETKEENQKYLKIMWDYVQENRRDVLKDKKIPRRDKYALYISFMGFEFFKLSWRILKKIRNGKI